MVRSGGDRDREKIWKMTHFLHNGRACHRQVRRCRLEYRYHGFFDRVSDLVHADCPDPFQNHLVPVRSYSLKYLSGKTSLRRACHSGLPVCDGEYDAADSTFQSRGFEFSLAVGKILGDSLADAESREHIRGPVDVVGYKAALNVAGE